MTAIRRDADGKRRTREEMTAMSLDDKIRAVEAWQVREYARLEARAKRGGRPIPRKWQQWRLAQCNYEEQLRRVCKSV